MWKAVFKSVCVKVKIKINFSRQILVHMQWFQTGGMAIGMGTVQEQANS